jgi:FAD/FMN-containing dehydrogenase
MYSSYEKKKRRLSEQLRAPGTATVRLGKETSNLFRDREEVEGTRLDVRDFHDVLEVDPRQGWVEVEGMTSYADLVDASLTVGVMPAVVPELKSITIGGAVSGIGIESSSFRYGLVHETIQEMEVLLGNGEVVLCTPHNEHRDLFFGLPNSYGTLGYILRLQARVVAVKPYVRLQHIRHTDARAYFADLADWCGRQGVDFVDGTVFSPSELYLTLGTFVEEAPYTSDYTYERIYYRSIRERETDYLRVHDYIWRWDTDWFWCSKNLFMQHPSVRRLAGRSRLNSVTYTRVMHWNSRWGITRRMNRLLGAHTESVIQDVDIPLANAPAFLEFFHREIGILPVWICPMRRYDAAVQFDLYPVEPGKIFVNFGFWDAVRSPTKRPCGYFNRKIEEMVRDLGGIKSLYSESFFTREEFGRIYNGDAYERLKHKYDPGHRLKNLYQKCVLRQ